MGLLVDVYRCSLGDCTANGISSTATALCLVNVDGPFDPSEKHPAALLVRGNGNGLLKIVPAMFSKNTMSWVRDGRWEIMGGNYASTSDSRFHRAVENIIQTPSYGAVPIHDRFEN
jgi:hypothetical protein